MRTPSLLPAMPAEAGLVGLMLNRRGSTVTEPITLERTTIKLPE